MPTSPLAPPYTYDCDEHDGGCGSVAGDPCAPDCLVAETEAEQRLAAARRGA